MLLRSNILQAFYSRNSVSQIQIYIYNISYTNISPILGFLEECSFREERSSISDSIPQKNTVRLTAIINHNIPFCYTSAIDHEGTANPPINLPPKDLPLATKPTDLAQ